ncbi:hypothetical protein [Rhizobium leucaenae]|uniref:hypothetical protein n=1 Tax=Rhizobium leucaenae TaxID=29450 RepID=UPI0016113701|nr:hypothetical protein [Rhizobium leucaenae]MBB6301311.1 hypothetical protein [Rhizobium leucaenae]
MAEQIGTNRFREQSDPGDFVTHQRKHVNRVSGPRLIRSIARIRGKMRIPMKPAIDSDLKPASHSDFIPAAVPI